VTRPARAGDVERFLTARLREGWAPGAAWWIEGRPGPLDSGAAGWAVLEPAPEPLTVATPFDLASLTKPLCTALLLVMLEGEGVELDAPAGDLLEPLRGSPYAAAPLRALACHAAGLPAWRPLYLRASTLDGYLRQIALLPPALPPGETLYSDLGYIALGAALERAAGRRLDRLFAERIAAPLGLRRTGFAVPPADYSDAAATERGNEYERAMAGEEGRDHDWPKEILRGRPHDGNARALGGVAGHAGLFGTVEEVAAIVRELLRPDRLGLTGPARRLLLEPPRAGGGRSVGLVVAERSKAARGLLPADALGHTGFTGTSMWIDPSRDAFCVLLTNRVHPRVPERGFHVLRRGFHRLASALARTG
jgi:CubicO group peptidase (beta-lactamase class C family)